MTVRKDDLFPTQYRATLSAMEREQSQLAVRAQQIEQERVAIQQRLQWISVTIESLRPLCEAEEQEQDTPRLQAVCYHVLANLGRAATAPEIRNMVGHLIDLGRYSNALAVIHTTLHRMPEVQAFKGTGGKTYFQVGTPLLTNPEG